MARSGPDGGCKIETCLLTFGRDFLFQIAAWFG